MEKKDIFGRMENPIIIRLSHLGNTILPLNGFEEELNITAKGVLINNTIREHFGFVVIADYNNQQHEKNYRTDNKIVALQMSDGKLKVYEENRIHPWLFHKSGKIIENNNATVDYSHKKCELDMNSSGHLEQNDGLIKIIIDTIKDEVNIDANGEIVPIIPGVVFGNEYYGINFEIIKRVEGSNQKVETIKTSYLTEDSLYGIEASSFNGNQTYRGCKLSEIETIKIYEREKYHPWKFTNIGELVEKSSYNVHSSRDAQAYEAKYGKRLAKDIANQ